MAAGDLTVSEVRVAALAPAEGLFVNGAFVDSDLSVFAVDDRATHCVIAQVANGGVRRTEPPRRLAQNVPTSHGREG